MKIGIIGAGKVGCTLGKYLTEAGIPVTGFYSKTRGSAQSAAAYSKVRVYETPEALVNASDTLFLTTPDGVLEQVWDCIAGYNLKNKVVCHFSGSLSSEIFHGRESAGASGCSIHPMYAFCDKFNSYLQFHTACLTLEGDDSATSALRELFEGRLHHTVFQVESKDKIRYHAAAALASNYVTGLLQMSMELLEDCGFGSREAMSLLEPLVLDNVKSVFEKDPVSALTGPVERNDVETVRKHIAALKGEKPQEPEKKALVLEKKVPVWEEKCPVLGKESPEPEEKASVWEEKSPVPEPEEFGTTVTSDSGRILRVYLEIGSELIHMAECRNPHRDYTALRVLMNQEGRPPMESDFRKKQRSGKEVK